MLTILLIVLLVIVLIGAVPAYRTGPYYGHGVSLLGLILIILLVLVLVDRL